MPTGADKGENLAAAGFYATDKNTEYELYLARNLPNAGGGEMERALDRRMLLARQAGQCRLLHDSVG